MASLRLLFYSGSIGLGHVTRDLAIAAAIRNLRPSAEIEWLASSPAREHLLDLGETLHPWAVRLSDATTHAEAFMRQGAFNITRWAVAVRRRWAADGRLALSAAGEGNYHAFIGDEAYDVAMALTGGAPPPGCPCFILYDFLGLDRMGFHPLEWLGVEAINRAWARDPTGRYHAVFLGELDDVPDRRFGIRRPSRRAWAREHASVVGHVIPFDPRAPADPAALKIELGYGDTPLILVAVGGTRAGGGLIDRCLEAFSILRARLPEARMLIVGGPRLALAVRSLPPGAEVRGYVPRLYRYLAACDLAVVQGGGATTLELTALQRPFIFFPLRDHCEQMKHVAARQERLGAGVRMSLRRTSPADLAEKMASLIGHEVRYPDLPLDGAHEVARLVAEAAGR
jgi:UDP-N-acetylglucosamine:LPS N-acetylglucosamine transferase